MPDLHYTDRDDRAFTAMLTQHAPATSPPDPPAPLDPDADGDDGDDEDLFSIAIAAFPRDGRQLHSSIDLPEPVDDAAVVLAAVRCTAGLLTQLGIDPHDHVATLAARHPRTGAPHLADDARVSRHDLRRWARQLTELQHLLPCPLRAAVRHVVDDISTAVLGAPSAAPETPS